MILNRQSEAAIDLRDVRRAARRIRSILKLGRRNFNVCFVSDREISRLNKAFRKKPRPTDVLSFPWVSGQRRTPDEREFESFLGDIIISPRTARRNARAEKHSLREEIRWLMLHGVLHLLGFDHETDSGEMNALELALRPRLNGLKRTKRQYS